MTDGQKLANELQQAILIDDKDASAMAAINLVAMLLDNQAAVAAVLERLTTAVESVAVYGGSINTISR